MRRNKLLTLHGSTVIIHKFGKNIGQQTHTRALMETVLTWRIRTQKEDATMSLKKAPSHK